MLFSVTLSKYYNISDENNLTAMVNKERKKMKKQENTKIETAKKG